MSTQKKPPYFTGRVLTQWLALESRKMLLQEAFSFTDKQGVVWVAPAGAIIDGASIPRFFWRFIGSPFSGHYRRASVIHDVYCVTQSRPHQQVHRMFYEAIRADGVGKLKAKAMYYALKIGGPRWSHTPKRRQSI